jgi:putative NIF3 family GTP cyclohydrolase 1 type 2
MDMRVLNILRNTSFTFLHHGLQCRSTSSLKMMLHFVGAVLDEVKRELMLVGCKMLYVHHQLATRISKTCQGTTVKVSQK